MQNADLVRQIDLKFRCLAPLLDERIRRQWAAAEALADGWAGASAVCSATGMFCRITRNWRRRPLVSHDVVINLIANTTTVSVSPNTVCTRHSSDCVIEFRAQIVCVHKFNYGHNN